MTAPTDVSRRPRPTDAEFEELKRKRDESVSAIVDAACKSWGWDRDAVMFHASGSHGCYCACPDGPCQHVWDGPQVPLGLEEGEDESHAHGWARSCSLCGADAMSHSMRCMP